MSAERVQERRSLDGALGADEWYQGNSAPERAAAPPVVLGLLPTAMGAQSARRGWRLVRHAVLLYRWARLQARSAPTRVSVFSARPLSRLCADGCAQAMSSTLDALAEALKAEFGAWGECKMPCDPGDAWRSAARVCLRVIGEGKVLPCEEIAGLLSTFPPHDKDHPSACLPQAEAILRAFREAGE